MFIKYNIKKFFGFYKNQSLIWIRVFQTDGTEYLCEVEKSKLKDEVKRLSPFIKKIDIL